MSWRRCLLAVLMAGCGGEVSATFDAAVPPADAAAAAIDAAPTGYLPDPVTMGEQLPAVIPVVMVNVGGAPVELDVVIPGTITVYEQHDGTLTDLATQTPTLSAPIGFQGRGNFTWSLPKKGYAFELQDGQGGDQARALLGLPPGSDFALYACYTDKSCLRNALVFGLGQQLGRWSPRTRFVELFLDDQYQGLYMIWERVRRDPARVDLPKVGGYIVRHEGGPEGDGSDFTTTAGVYYRYHYPNVAEITPAQAEDVRASWQAMEDALAADPAAYAGVIDEASWVDRAIVEEVTNNWDGYVHSIYMTRAAPADGGRVGMGPLWDFDLAFGNGNVTGYNCQTDTWAYQIQRGSPDDVPAYWLALWADAGFQQAWKCRYQALRQGPLADATFATRIADWAAFTASARARDQARWPTIGVPTFPNCTTEPSYDAELIYLQDWISARLTWLDQQAAALPGTCP